MRKNLTLTGMMGVGKSTVGKILAKKLNYNFVDVDKLIEAEEGISINLIFKNKSESYFRKIESEITLLELKKSNSIISLGGGAFLDNTIRKSAKKLSTSFWLDVPVEELIKRLKKNRKRPLLFRKNTNETVKKIYFDRKKIYNEADHRIKCNSLRSEEIADRILNLYEKKPEAQLLLDLLREQKQSSKFYDDKINFLLGVTNKTSSKINEKNLLNFYLSSLTIADFKYEPTKKTKPEIWKYLNSANLIKLEDASDKEKLKELEIAANNDQLNKNKIFEIYKQIPFSLNTLINAKSNYQTLNDSDARALIYQKYLLSEANESKVEYLFLLEELFKKADLINIYSKYLSDRIEEIGIENLPENFREEAIARVVSDEDLLLGKVKYNDKILHQSKILKYYVEGENKKKVQKDIDKIFKKINKNKKYFVSAKDLALVDTLITDGFSLPPNFKYKELAEEYNIPDNLLKLIENDEKAFLALKIVEIIGEDEPYELDPETIYFVTNLLNKMNLVTIRNKVLNSALPLRT